MGEGNEEGREDEPSASNIGGCGWTEGASRWAGGRYCKREERAILHCEEGGLTCAKHTDLCKWRGLAEAISQCLGQCAIPPHYSLRNQRLKRGWGDALRACQWPLMTVVEMSCKVLSELLELCKDLAQYEQDVLSNQPSSASGLKARLIRASGSRAHETWLGYRIPLRMMNSITPPPSHKRSLVRSKQQLRYPRPRLGVGRWGRVKLCAPRCPPAFPFGWWCSSQYLTGRSPLCFNQPKSNIERGVEGCRFATTGRLVNPERYLQDAWMTTSSWLDCQSATSLVHHVISITARNADAGKPTRRGEVRSRGYLAARALMLPELENSNIQG